MKYRLNKGFIAQKIGKKTTIFDGEKSVLYTFNETASYIFQKLKAGFDEKKIVDRLVKKYKKDKKEVEKDVKDYIADLLKKKILKLTSQSSKKNR